MNGKLKPVYYSVPTGHRMPYLSAMTTVSLLMLIAQVTVADYQKIEMSEQKHNPACLSGLGLSTIVMVSSTSAGCVMCSLFEKIG